MELPRQILTFKNIILDFKKSSKVSTIIFVLSNFDFLKEKKITLKSVISNFKTEIETIKNFITLDDKNSLESSIEKINNLEGPIAYVLGESLSASVVSNKDQNKENFWLRGFENNENIKLPNSSKPLTEDINDHKILKNSLKGVGLVKNSEKML